MLHTPDFKTDSQQQEILPMDSDAFPYICNYAELDTCVEKRFSWHWHTAFELDYIEAGEIELRTADNTVTLKQGDAFFVNSNVLHDIRASGMRRGCRTYAHLFDMHLLSGMYNSLFEQKYILPILKSTELQVYVIHPDTARRIHMVEKLLRLAELAGNEGFGYEFEIRAELCRLWCLLLEETEAVRTQTHEGSRADSGRIKAMLAFIHGHYTEKITLDDICAAANISSRECCRCFQRSIGMSPILYLTRYRVRMAAQMLLYTGDSVTAISENCGFSSVSYFGKVFQETMQCSPREYRKAASAEITRSSDRT